MLRHTCLILCLFLIPAAAIAAPTPIWLDVDTSTGVVKQGRQADVDDGLAILYAMHSPEVEVVGVSVQFGNATLGQAVPIAEQIVRELAPPRYRALPVHAGAASADDLGKQTEATRALVAALEAAEEPIAIHAVGPVTNVATVVREHPELHEKISRIVVVAARREGFVFGPPQAPEGTFFPDANFEKDVEGMRVLLESGIPLIFAGYEVSSDVWITREDLEALATMSEAGRWVARTSRPWLEQWLEKLRTPGFNPFDTLALAYETHPELLDGFRARLSIREGIDERATAREQESGKTKRYLWAERDDRSPHLYLAGVHKAFHEVLLERLGGEGEANQEGQAP